MSQLRACVYEDEPLRLLTSIDALNDLLRQAAAEAKDAERLNIIFLYGPNDDHLTLVVGGDETVLAFTHGHLNPPYYASDGNQKEDDPVLVAYVGLSHYTELRRRWVVPMAWGELAAAEFLTTGQRPTSIGWVEV